MRFAFIEEGTIPAESIVGCCHATIHLFQLECDLEQKAGSEARLIRIRAQVACHIHTYTLHSVIDLLL